MLPLTKKSFAGGHFELRIDQERVSAHVKSLDGGMPKTATAEEASAGFHLRDRHAATRDVESLSLELGISGAAWALRGMESILDRREHKRYSGALVHCDSNFVEQFAYEFERALLTELVLPKLDAKSKDFPMVKAKLQPESFKYEMRSGAAVPPGTTARQKLWQSSAFRLTLDRCPSATAMATSVEAITLKVGAKAYQTGKFRLPEYNPTKIDIGKLSFTIPLAHAEPLFKWHRESVVHERGAEDGGAYETTGGLEFLDPTRTRTVWYVALGGVGLENCTVVKNDANQNATKQVKVDCYITSIKLNVAGALGFV